VAIASNADLIIGLEDGLWVFSPETKRMAMLTPMRLAYGVRLNDGKADLQGRLWFGSMDKTGSGAPVGGLFCRHRDGTVQQVRSEVRVPNAIAVSPDGGTFYFADTPTAKVLAFDLDQTTGALTNERAFATYRDKERPDGTAVDVEGGIWIAVVNGSRVDRHRPDGTLDVSLATPVTRPTMPALGGPELTTLYLTSQRRFLSASDLATQPAAGSLLAQQVETPGFATIVAV
jgi:sugar lactone lactonase YvrE